MKHTHWTRLADLLNVLVVCALVFSSFANLGGASAQAVDDVYLDGQEDDGSVDSAAATAPSWLWPGKTRPRAIKIFG
jgi:hypothetical protein